MKVLTSAEMRDVDRRTIELGIPGPILMENAGHRVVEFILHQFAPISEHRVVVLCGNGNNGGDGFVIARQLFTRFRLRSLHVVATTPDGGSEPLRMLRACGCGVHQEITPAMRQATLVIDAVLGTGLDGPARGKSLEYIREINTGFPSATVLAVDVPSGMNSDGGDNAGEIAHADFCITFTAPKVCHVVSPNCDRVGSWSVRQIGSPPALMEHVALHLTTRDDFRHLFAPRVRDSNKGLYGHVLVVGGSQGKSGAAEMAGLSALRAGAGLVTVASSVDRHTAPELMTERLPQAFAELETAAARKTVVAIGPGLSSDQSDVVRDAVSRLELPMIIDADGLNILAGHDWNSLGRLRILTPHPGEMARLSGISIPEVQADRLGVARSYASKTDSVVVLKGHRTVTAWPDGTSWINPTGSPGMATGGTGDILTGLIAGLLAQFPDDPRAAVLAAVFLHGRAGELGAQVLGEKSLLATDLLGQLPEAMRECTVVSHEL